MPKDFEGIVNDYSYTQNRELSWLRFNRRVLEEAADDLVPPLERLKFISIFSSNLDEFFMVRVGSLLDLSLVSPDEIDNKSGLDPAEQLQAIYEAIPSLLEIKGQLYSRVSTLLAQAGVQDLSYDDLTAEEQAQVDDDFRAVVLPVLSPQIVGQRHPSPRLDNKALYITALLRSKSGKAALGFVPCPASLPPIFPLPESRGRFLRLETIVCHWTPTLFKKYTVEELCVISATRNADLSFDREKFEDSDRDFRTMMTQMLKKRANQAIVRLEMDRRPSQELLRLLGESIQVQTHQIYCDSAPLAMGYVYGLENALPEDLRRSLTYQPYTPRWPEDLSRQESMIEQIQRKDRLLFFPFDSIDPFLKLLEEAAERPDVKSIKITIYRLASTSKIARILCRAAENIQVTSIVGRYLEHARVYVFGRGSDAKYFIASADLMTRNLRRRVEIACPIFAPAIQDQLRYLLDLQLQDNAKASFLQPSGAYLRKEVHGPRIDSQAELMKTTLHRPEPDPVPRPNQSFFQRLMALLRGA